jgi:hypothetical protein
LFKKLLFEKLLFEKLLFEKLTSEDAFAQHLDRRQVGVFTENQLRAIDTASLCWLTQDRTTMYAKSSGWNHINVGLFTATTPALYIVG